MADAIIEGIVAFFMQCPLLKDGVFRLNALSGKPMEYVIETGVFNPVVRRYVNGDTERIYQFHFGSREYYSLDRLTNLESGAFYEEFAQWVEAQDRMGNYPEMPEKCTPQALTVLSPGYVYDGALQNARYQIQLQLDYYKEA